MNNPNPAAPIIKKLAIDLLQKTGSFKIPELREYAESCGYSFTQGQFAGALRSLLDNASVTSPARGVYSLSSTRGINPLLQDLTLETSLKNQINQVLDQTLYSLRQLASVNLLDVDDNFMKEIKTLKEIINAIEKLKV